MYPWTMYLLFMNDTQANQSIQGKVPKNTKISLSVGSVFTPNLDKPWCRLNLPSLLIRVGQKLTLTALIFKNISGFIWQSIRYGVNSTPEMELIIKKKIRN